MVTACELIHVVDVANVLGEGVLWNESTNTVWWTDIESSQLFEYDPVSDSLKSWDTPHRVACFGFIEDSDDLVVAFDAGIAIYDVEDGIRQWLVEPGVLADGVRFNDGKVDAAGRLWVGTLVEDASIADSAALYRLDPGAGLVEQVSDITISNGLCWSPDGSVMYHADSPTGTIRAFRFDAESGTPSEPVTLARTGPGVHPDGSTVDADGGVWNAQWGGAQVLRYTESGETSVTIDLPVSQPTCVAFGGENLDLLLVTSARVGLDGDALAKETEAGSLFVCRTSFKGLPASRFRVW